MTAMNVDKTPVRTETGPDGEELYPESSRSLESLREMRLMALLRDMIEAEDGAKAAEALGVSYRTVSRVVESGRLTERMSAVLERHLLLGGGSAAAQQRERVEALETQVAAWEGKLRSGLESVVAEVKALRDEQAQAMGRIERRLAALEAGRAAQDASETAPAAGEKPVVRPRWRLHRELVTQEPEPGEEQVYGGATPVIVEWRKARAEFLKALKTGTTLDRTETQERMLKLEIAIIEEHELTLPPASYPWDRFGRRDKVWERTQDLNRVQVERNRALLRRWLRRVFTLRLWRD